MAQLVTDAGAAQSAGMPLTAAPAVAAPRDLRQPTPEQVRTIEAKVEQERQKYELGKTTIISTLADGLSEASTGGHLGSAIADAIADQLVSAGLEALFDRVSKRFDKAFGADVAGRLRTGDEQPDHPLTQMAARLIAPTLSAQARADLDPVRLTPALLAARQGILQRGPAEFASYREAIATRQKANADAHTAAKIAEEVARQESRVEGRR